MKKLYIIVLLISFVSVSFAQTLNKKNFRTTDYQTKVFKNSGKRVYINSFNVFYQVFVSATARTTERTTTDYSFGTKTTGRTKTTMGIAIDGVDNADFLEITNIVYKKFIDDLSEKGYTIISAEEAGKTEVFSDYLLKNGGEVNYAQSEGYVKVSPSNYKYFVKNVNSDGKEKKSFSSQLFQGGYNGKLSDQLDDAIIADVSFVFDFAWIKAKASEWTKRSKVEGGVYFKFIQYIQPDWLEEFYKSSITFTCDKAFNSLHKGQIHTELKKDVLCEAPVFKDETFSEVTRASSNMDFSPDWFLVVFEDVETNVSHKGECNPQLYKQESVRFMSEFIDYSLNRLFEEME